MKQTFWKRALKSITEFMFLSLILSSIVLIINLILLCWYSTIVLQNPYFPEDVCKEISLAVFGAISVKVLGNIFEHNNGSIFGISDTEEQND